MRRQRQNALSYNRYMSDQCAECGEEVKRGRPGEPCRVCGGTSRVLVRVVTEQIRVLDGYAFKQKRHSSVGRRRIVAEGFSRYEPSHKAALVRHDRSVDRDKDRYRELVVDADTGTVLHHDEGKLSEHQGHGSAKKRREG